MKKIIICFFTMLVLFISEQLKAQWLTTGTTTTDFKNRTGGIGVGGSAVSNSIDFYVKKTVTNTSTTNTRLVFGGTSILGSFLASDAVQEIQSSSGCHLQLLSNVSGLNYNSATLSSSSPSGWGLKGHNLGTNTALPFFIYNNGAERLRISTDGLVLIGTGTPTQKLHIDNGNLIVKGTNNFANLGDVAFTYLGDVNNYIKAQNGSGLRLSAFGANDGLVLANGGNVGIGITSPTQKLQIDNGNIFARGTNNFAAAGNNAYLYLGDLNNYIKAQNGSGIKIGAFQAEDGLVLANGGNVGIGLSVPQTKLNIKEPTAGAVYALFQNIGNETTNTQDLLVGMLGEPGNGHQNPTNGEGVIASQSGGIQFYTSPSGNQITEFGQPAIMPTSPFPPSPSNGNLRLVIKGESGNVGIASERPKAQFQIKDDFTRIAMGPIRSTNSMNAINYFGFNALRGPTKWELENDGANNGGVIMHTTPWGAFRISTIPPNGTTGRQVLDDETTLKNNLRFEITESGQVFIDKPNMPDNNNADELKLIVGGGILCEKVKVALDETANWSWPDYVFADDFKLKSLNEVEKFIKENNHLPDVPSSCDVEENGIDLAQMNAKLLQKIEELTLHLIAQGKEIEGLKKVIGSDK